MNLRHLIPTLALVASSCGPAEGEERPLGARISVGYRAAEGVDALSSPHGAGASVRVIDAVVFLKNNNRTGGAP